MPYGGFELRMPHVPRNEPFGANFWNRLFHASAPQTLPVTGSTATSRISAKRPATGSAARGRGRCAAGCRSESYSKKRKLP